jgi:hypothetical protein
VATPSGQTSILRKDEFATPKAPNKSVAGTRNIVQADIKVSFMGPQDICESQATYAVCSNLYPSGRDTDAHSAGGLMARLFVAGLCGLADVIEAFRSHGVDSDMM